jgi:ribulose-phosphate 3-epimerase
MIKSPDNFIPEFANAGANYISVHFEEVVHLNRTINRIKELGVKAGVVINPSTPVQSLSSILEDVDFVLIMSVNPGFGGQKFIPSSIKKIYELNRMKRELNLNFQIEIDGGINKDNLRDVIIAGTDIVVAGASIFNTDNISAAVTEFKNIISSI